MERTTIIFIYSFLYLIFTGHQAHNGFEYFHPTLHLTRFFRARTNLTRDVTCKKNILKCFAVGSTISAQRTKAPNLVCSLLMSLLCVHDDEENTSERARPERRQINKNDFFPSTVCWSDVEWEKCRENR